MSGDISGALAYSEAAKKRLMAKVRKDSGTGCWIFTGWLDPGGYGRCSFGGKTQRAHRVSYQLFIGDIPAGLELDHLCRVRECVNPYHLEAVTPSQNRLRGLRGFELSGRCRSGLHDISQPGAVSECPNGERQCRECHLEHGRNRRKVVREACEALGTTYNAYVAKYGESRATAERVLITGMKVIP